MTPAMSASAVGIVAVMVVLGSVQLMSFPDFPGRELSALFVFIGAAAIMTATRRSALMTRRMALLAKLGLVFGPRQDLHKAICTFAETLRAHYNADLCLIVLHDPRSNGWVLYEANGDGELARQRAIPAAIAQPLLAIPNDCSALYNARRRGCRPPACLAYDVAGAPVSTPPVSSAVLQLAQLLEAGSLVSLPLRSGGESMGRLHIVARRRVFARDSVHFLASAAGLAGLTVKNLQLADRLARKVADQERKKISRDLHDGTIQPYIGLKLALEALHRRVQADPGIAHEVKGLLDITTDGITQLRKYVGRLKSSAHGRVLEPVLPAIRQQAEKFSKYYDIDTNVTGDEDIAVEGTLLQHLMFLVREGLSNIHRHTESRKASVRLASFPGGIELRFVNDNEVLSPAGGTFFPRSIGERAAELSGGVDVHMSDETVVTVRIPI